jgi:hypothetical protein
VTKLPVISGKMRYGHLPAWATSAITKPAATSSCATSHRLTAGSPFRIIENSRRGPSAPSSGKPASPSRSSWGYFPNPSRGHTRAARGSSGEGDGILLFGHSAVQRRTRCLRTRCGPPRGALRTLPGICGPGTSVKQQSQRIGWVNQTLDRQAEVPPRHTILL